MSAQTKRLFIGGLNSVTNEQDIRERFRTFGSVQSVEIHRVEKKQGFPEKTFAYVNIDALDSSIKKCISMLSNTKWKGGILKIQPAKENFLSRLQKERETAATEKAKLEVKDSKPTSMSEKLTNPIPKAVPGTLIPGKRNWVVGKFGRALPVVHMRQRVGNKILKLDPSKTVHNLKRIKDDVEDDKPVSELTWSLEEARRNGDDGSKHMVKDEDESSFQSSSSSEDEEILSPRDSKKKSKRNGDDVSRHMVKDKDDNSFQSSSSSDDEEILSPSDTKKKRKRPKDKEHRNISGNQENVGTITTQEDQDGHENQQLNSPDSTMSVNALGEKNERNNSRHTSRKTHKKYDEPNNHLIDVTDVEHGTTNDNKTKKKEEKREKLSSDADSDRDITDDCKPLTKKHKMTKSKLQHEQLYLQELEDKESKRKTRGKGRNPEDNSAIESVAENGLMEKGKHDKKQRRKDKTQSDNDKQTKGSFREDSSVFITPAKRRKETPTKKIRSNEKRLKAVKERELSLNYKQSVIAAALKNLDDNDTNNTAALKNLDDNNTNNTKLIKFDDDDDTEENKNDVTEEEANKTLSGKISGSQASDWLGLDNASDDSDVDFDGQTKDGHMFAAKSQFEGQSGQKLFKLQKSYSGDSRFQLDQRFVASDSEGEDAGAIREAACSSDSEASDTQDEDNISKQISKEKDMSMSVLRGILGKNIGIKYGDGADRKDEFVDSTLLRYDPTRDDHTQFEQTPKKEGSPEPGAEEESDQPAAVVACSVSSEKYYDVKADVLTELFGAKKKVETTSPFTFLADQDSPDEFGVEKWGEAEELRSKPWNAVMLPYDSSGDEHEVDDDEQQPSAVQHALPPDQPFFFHFGDLELESRVYDQENAFMRTATLDQLNEHWINIRSDLTYDYKKKHKDAVRRHSKMAAKRVRHR